MWINSVKFSGKVDLLEKISPCSVLCLNSWSTIYHIFQYDDVITIKTEMRIR